MTAAPHDTTAELRAKIAALTPRERDVAEQLAQIFEPLLADLDALRVRAETAEHERDHALRSAYKEGVAAGSLLTTTVEEQRDVQIRRAVTAEARAAALEADLSRTQKEVERLRLELTLPPDVRRKAMSYCMEPSQCKGPCVGCQRLAGVRSPIPGLHNKENET